MSRAEYWNQIYQAKGCHEVSWYQQRPSVSLELIAAAGTSKDNGIVDIGGGASNLVDYLLDEGYSKLAVLDISGDALEQSRTRLGLRAGTVAWFETAVASFEPPQLLGLWHDRAMFHFLTEAEDRKAYLAALRRALQPGAAVILATFAKDGPAKCSGLEVVRYDEQSMLAELGSEFQLQELRYETHRTPWQSEQRFIYFRLQWQR